MSATNCPTPHTLSQWLAEELANRDRTAVESHVETCGTCQSALESLLNDALPSISVGYSVLARRTPCTPTAEPPIDRSTMMSPAARRDDDPATPVRTLPGYEILDLLGRGGMGVVYKARHLSLNRIVALKFLHANRQDEAASRERLRTEAEAAARLHHPNIVQIYDIGESDHGPFLALEYVESGTLAQAANGNPQPLRDAAQLTATLARAIQFAHEHGIIHRDLKPANILLERSAESGEQRAKTKEPSVIPLSALRSSLSAPKIADFGLARWLDQDAGQTPSGAVLGTPSYMAPEQANGPRSHIGPAADVYSLGAILYELLTGRPPFKGETAVETMVQALHEAPVPPSRLRPNLPRDLETICLKCLRKEPGRRYASAAALAEDLERFLEGRPIVARPVSGAERFGRWCRRRPAMAALVFVSGLALAALLAVLVASDLRIYQKNRETEKALNAETEAKRVLAGTLAEERRTQYVYRIRLAYAAWLDNNSMQAEEFLDACRPQPGQPDLRGWEWYHLKRLTGSELHVFRETTDGVLTIALSPDGKRVASVSNDGTAKIWDVQSGQVHVRMPAVNGSIGSHQAAFSPDGTLLAYASHSQLTVWDVADGRVRYRLRGDQFAFDPAGRQLVSADRKDNKVRLYNLTTGAEEGAGRVPLGENCRLAFGSDGLLVVTPAEDTRVVEVWDAVKEKRRLTLRHPSFVTALALTQDGRCLAAGCEDGSVTIWNALTGEKQGVMPKFPGFIQSATFSPDGRRLVIGDAIGSLKIWDAQGNEFLSLRGHVRPVLATSFSQDGQQLASAAAYESTIKIWDATRDAEATILQKHTDVVRGMAFSPDGSRAASWDNTPILHVWDPATATVLYDLEGRSIKCAAFGPDGGRLTTCDEFANVTDWDAKTKEQIRTVRGSSNEATLISAMNPLGTRIAQASGNTVKLLDATTGQLLFELRGHTDEVRSLAFSTDGRRLASTSKDRTVKVWNAGTGREEFTLRGHIDVGCATFSADGRRIASAGFDKIIRLWDGETGREILQIRNRIGGNIVNSLAFSPDGRRLASGGINPTVTLWDTETGEEVLTLRTRRMGVNFLAFAPTGRHLAAVTNDNAITVWEASAPPTVSIPADSR